MLNTQNSNQNVLSRFIRDVEVLYSMPNDDFYGNRNVCLLKQTIQTPNFRLLRRNRSAALPMRVLSMNSKQKVSSLVNTVGGAAAPSQIL